MSILGCIFAVGHRRPLLSPKRWYFSASLPERHPTIKKNSTIILGSPQHFLGVVPQSAKVIFFKINALSHDRVPIPSDGSFFRER